MTATDELRRLLDERGVEWGANDTYRLLVTSWKDASGHSWTFTEYRDGTFSKLTAYHLTPEQAIAATLGANDARTTQAESSGTLTAEKVRELMEENSRQYPSPTDPYVWLTEYDWQAIADELNATLGAGTCQIETTENWLPAERYHRCNHCGAFFAVLDASGDIPPHCCPNCGRRVVE